MSDNTLAGLINAQQELLTVINASMEENAELYQTGELDQDVLDLVTKLLSQKVDQVGYVVNHLMPANIAALKDQAKVYQQAAAYQTKSMERFKLYIKRVMTDMDVLSIQGKSLEIKLMDSPPSVETGDTAPEDFAGTEFVETRIDYAWRKNEIKSAATRGDELPPGVQVVRGKYLKFKPVKV